ncbi:MAG: GNAT family N-acetyltransferase [Saprospiraceae bacterium]|nr:GNAT family N-acetyltransferase [Saprospiraceae bacterium]
MYEFKQLDLSRNGIQEISDLLNIVFPDTDANSYEYLDWEYNKNPEGKAVGFNAYIEKSLAAHYVTQPIKSIINGVETKGLLSLNTATHPDHRGKRLFTDLAEKTYELAAKEGYKFVIGVANENSIKGFTKYLGFKLLKPLDVKIGIGLHKESQNNDYSYSRIWDKETIKWRLSNPIIDYKLKVKKGQTYILAPTKKFGIYASIGIFDNGMFDETPILGKTVFNKVRIWIGLDDNINWKKSAYISFPDKLKPSPLYLIFKDLTNDNISLDTATMKFQCIDFDAY